MSAVTRQRRTHGQPRQAALLLCVALAVALPAVAADDQDPDLNPLAQGRSLGSVGLAGGALLGGFRFEPQWSLDAESVGFDSGASALMEYDDASRSAQDNAGIYALHGVRLSGSGTLPINQGLSLFGKMGVTSLGATRNGLFKSGGATGMDLSLGAGGRYIFSPDLSLHAEWDRYTDYQGEIDLFSAGIRYNFK